MGAGEEAIGGSVESPRLDQTPVTERLHIETISSDEQVKEHCR